MKNKIKTFTYDLETSPSRGYFFGRTYETNIIKVDEYETIICASYVDSVTNKVKNIAQWDFKGYKKGKWDDKKLVKRLREIILEGDYDLINGQNSDQFDNKFLNARLAFHGFDPLPEIKTLDTKKIAKSKLKLASYTLDFMLQYFGLGGKYHHSGIDMWFNSRDGDIKAQKEMVHYCNIDAMQTHLLVQKLLPFMKQFNHFQPKHDIDIICSNPLCRSTNLIKARPRRLVGGWKQQYQCKDCGKYTQGRDWIKR